ncbi:AraC family ligand binding domain-containing protein [Psychromarinibacter sp. C21-152]|uniref:AraC family ligand binding domain-containing protein n=1 Tax=Psychromarinibacter sediminicola TaxID=3033385 RepID=A0AAE3NQE6_9RHOB|nr:AraC family ligand binding domain-containing protein [Psychromarinibacter sediminicola]MDF0600192.1 AraC family ligand binding domain-containing protein [Psychromarinibacter sediminicola]
MTGAQVFHAADRHLKPAVTETGTTMIAREIGTPLSRHMGAGIEVLDGVTIDWTVTYDEVLFIHSGRLTVEFDGTRHDCAPGDIVWLPKGTSLRYIAEGRAEYFYALYPVDWAARQGVEEP